MARPVICWKVTTSRSHRRLPNRICGRCWRAGIRGWRRRRLAADGQVIQYLAGAPDLLDRYQHAPPEARALIDAAMDASRLGMGPALPRAFVEAAATGYMTDTDWDLLDDDWAEQALDYTAARCKGVRGPLAEIRPRPGVRVGPAGAPTWRLADYLDQYGRRARREEIPPVAFWAAAATYADPTHLTSLAQAAEGYGLLREAARLYRQASGHGDPDAGPPLIRLLHALHPGDQRPAAWAAAHVSLDDLGAVTELLGTLREAGATGQAAALASRAAADCSIDDPAGVARLLFTLREAGAAGQVTALLNRDPAAHASLDDSNAVSALLHHLHGALLDHDPAGLDDSTAVGASPHHLQEAEATSQITSQITILAGRAVADIGLSDPYAVAFLLDRLREAGATGQITALLDRDPATHVSLDHPDAVRALLSALRQAGATGQVATLLDRDPAAHVSLNRPDLMATLLDGLREAGATGQATALASRAAGHTSLDNPDDIRMLLDALRKAGATAQVTMLLDRDPAAHVSLDDPGGVGRLLGALRDAGATAQVTMLLDRDPAAHVSVDDSAALTWLLGALRRLGATGQVTKLLDRDPAAHVSLDGSAAVTELLDHLHAAGAPAQAAKLIERLPAAGQFPLFCDQEGREDQFPFGREADGRPAQPWAWTDLG
jgi:uncharacterized protein YidB (DUF937 family)